MYHCPQCLTTVELNENGRVPFHRDPIVDHLWCFCNNVAPLEKSKKQCEIGINYAFKLIDDFPEHVDALTERITKLTDITTKPKAERVNYLFPRRMVSGQVHDDDRQKVLDYIKELNHKRNQETL